MMRVAVVLFATAALHGPAAQNPPPPSVGGRVVAAVTGDPIRNARVSVKAGRDLPPVLTDGDGRFAFPDLPRANVTITASKPGFAKVSVDVTRATAGAIVIALQRGAAISGVVMDDAGEPVPSVSVMVEPPEARDKVQRMNAEIENPEFLQSLVAGATRVMVSDGQRTTLTLRVR